MYDSNFDVIGVFDWEMAFLGDPELDLTWFFMLDWTHSGGAGTPRLEGTPEKEESIRRYEELTGWKVKNLFYNDVLAALKFGVILYKIYSNFKKIGIMPMESDAEHNNICTQAIASLLGLPSPGAPPEQRKRVEEITATVQLRLTGPGGGDWYVVADKGKGTRHKGTVDNPDATVIVSAQDWDAILRGELARIHAWTGGKLKVEGNESLWRQLDDMISKLWSA
jgi:putative sterol carrier protein